MLWNFSQIPALGKQPGPMSWGGSKSWGRAGEGLTLGFAGAREGGLRFFFFFSREKALLPLLSGLS